MFHFTDSGIGSAAEMEPLLFIFNEIIVLQICSVGQNSKLSISQAIVCGCCSVV